MVECKYKYISEPKLSNKADKMILCPAEHANEGHQTVNDQGDTFGFFLCKELHDTAYFYIYQKWIKQWTYLWKQHASFKFLGGHFPG